MNTSDLMLSGASLPDAARLSGHVPGGPGCGAKPISDATAEERAGGAAAFAAHLRRIDGGTAERGSGDGQGVGEEGGAGETASGRTGERASAAGVKQGEAPGSSVAESGSGTSGAARAAGETPSPAIDGEDGEVAVPLDGSPSLLASGSTTAALSPGDGITAAVSASAVLAGAAGEAPLAGDSPTSGSSSSDARLADGPAVAVAAGADDRADTDLLAVGEGIAPGSDEDAAAPSVAQDDVLSAAARDAIASEGDDVDALSIESPISASTFATTATADDDRAIGTPVGDSASGVSPTGFSVNGIAAVDGPTLEGGAVVASMTERAATAAAGTLRAEDAAAAAVAATRTPTDAVASAPSAAEGVSPSGSASVSAPVSVSAGTLANSSEGGEAIALSDDRTNSVSAERPALSGRADAAGALARQSAAAESPAAVLDASGPTSSAGTPSAGAPLVSSEATSVRRATVEGVAVPPASALQGVNVSTSPAAADATVAAAPTALLAAGAAGARGRAPEVDPRSGADAAKGDASMPVLVADVLRKRQVETTHRVEAFREGQAMNVAAERRIGPIALEASPLADATDGEVPAQRSVSLPPAGATAPLVSLPTQTPGVSFATRVDMSPSPAPIAPHNVSLGSGADATELAAGVRWTLGEGRGQALVNVTPAGLGPVSIRVTLEGDQMNVSILASQAGAREALESLVPRLRDQLAAEGHERVQVDVSSGRQDGQARAGTQPQDDGGRSGTGRATGDEADERDDESLAQQGLSMRDGTGRGGAGARSLIDAWA